jgi:hypothetical protein
VCTGLPVGQCLLPSCRRPPGRIRPLCRWQLLDSDSNQNCLMNAFDFDSGDCTTRPFRCTVALPPVTP